MSTEDMRQWLVIIVLAAACVFNSAGVRTLSKTVQLMIKTKRI